MNKKRWSIAVMAILALTACGKNETNQVSTADKNEVSPDSYSADDSSSEPILYAFAPDGCGYPFQLH